MTDLIPHCVAMGEAAGAAAALAIDAGVPVRQVDIRALQDHLRKQGVPLPDNPKTEKTVIKKAAVD